MSAMDLSQTASTTNEVIIQEENSTENPNSSLPPTPRASSSNVVVVNIDNNEKEIPKKGRKRKSAVWEYFNDSTITVKGVTTQALQCICCATKFNKPKSGTTSQLLRHVKECDKIKTRNKEIIDLPDKRQKFLNFLPCDASSEIKIPIFHDPKNYDHLQIREIIAKMIIVHEYPFKIVEHTWFNILLKVLNHHYERVSRNTIKSDCMKVFLSEKEKLKTFLTNIRRVSLTSDCWTSNQTVGYMCLTIHFIDDSWKLHTRIINFVELEPPHTGTFICDAICECLLEWNLQDKVSTITLDNASNNDVAATALKLNFQSRDKLHFQGHFFHVRCCAHILNIMVQDGLKEIHDVIYQIRESVKYLKKSPARLHRFVEVAKQLGVPTSKGLCIDVPTRWNSTYLMLESAFVYRTVFLHYAARDTNYKWLPSENEWQKYEQIRKFLAIFYNVTKMISGSSYPTTNLFLPSVMHVKKLLMEECSSTFEYIRHMVHAMKIKFDKYWGECNLLMSVAAVLDPRFKMKFIEFTFPKIYSPFEVDEKIKEVEDVMTELHNQYVIASASTSIPESSTSRSQREQVASSSFDCMLGFTDFVVATGSIQPIKSDLQIYLEEGLFKCNAENFDVLDWWKLNILKYPSLSNLAKDILSIPITTVASESTFSAGGRVLDDYRSSLSTKTVNALVCTSSWIKGSQNITTNTLQDLMEEENLTVRLPD